MQLSVSLNSQHRRGPQIIDIVEVLLYVENELAHALQFCGMGRYSPLLERQPFPDRCHRLANGHDEIPPIPAGEGR